MMSPHQQHRSMALVAFVVFLFLLSFASLAASQQYRADSSPWVSSLSGSVDTSSSSSANGVTSFRKKKHGRQASGDSDADDADEGDASTSSKTIAQRIDEALEQEFPEEKKDSVVGKTYTEKAKQEDVRLAGGKREGKRQRERRR